MKKVNSSSAKGRVALIGTVVSCILGFRKELIETLITEGYEVFAFGIDYTPETEAQVRAIGAIPVSYQLERAGLNPFKGLVSILRLSRQLKQLAPDLVLSYFAKPVIFGSLAAQIAKVPKRYALLEGLGLAFTRQPEAPTLKLRLIRRSLLLLYRLVFPGLHKVIFLNPDDRDELIESGCLSSRKSELLGGIGLNLKAFPYTPIPQGRVNFLFVGRLLKEKGVREFIQAACQIKREYPEVCFTLVGGLDEQSPGGLSAQEWQQLQGDGAINATGPVSDVLSQLQAASVFVLPSYREGVPRSTQEAMSVGRAVITTDVPGCRETVKNGVNGFLIPPWDAESLADKMRYFIQHPDAAAAMGFASRQLAEDYFDAETVNARLLRILALECSRVEPAGRVSLSRD